MTVIVYMDAAGAVWIANGQGDILAEGFFKMEDETEDELRQMGYPRLLTVYPTVHLAAGTARKEGALASESSSLTDCIEWHQRHAHSRV